MPLLSFIKIKASRYYAKCKKIKQQYRFEVQTFKHKHSVMEGLKSKHNINGLKIKKKQTRLTCV